MGRWTIRNVLRACLLEGSDVADSNGVGGCWSLYYMDLMLGDTSLIVRLVRISFFALIDTGEACETLGGVGCVQGRVASDGLRDPMREGS